MRTTSRRIPLAIEVLSTEVVGRKKALLIVKREEMEARAKERRRRQKEAEERELERLRQRMRIPGEQGRGALITTIIKIKRRRQ